MKFLILYWLGVFFIVQFICGCSIVPKETRTGEATRSASTLAANNATEFRKVAENIIPEIHVCGSSNTVNFSSPPMKTFAAATNAASQDAGEDKALKFEHAEQIPLGVKIALLAFGILLLGAVLIGGVKYLKAQSPAAAIALSRADSAIANLIDHHTQFAMRSTDPRDIAAHSGALARLEKERGKLHNKSNV